MHSHDLFASDTLEKFTFPIVIMLMLKNVSVFIDLLEMIKDKKI